MADNEILNLLREVEYDEHRATLLEFAKWAFPHDATSEVEQLVDDFLKEKNED